MKPQFRIVVLLSAFGLATGLGSVSQHSAWAQSNSPFTVTDGEHKAHIFPTVALARQVAKSHPDDFGPLLYNGGPIMTGGTILYNIYWLPAHLQTGAATTMSSHYRAVQTNLLHDYLGHSIANNSTQYYQTISSVTLYFANRQSGYVTYVDSNPYPASGCTDTATPGNCITDAQLQVELQRVMAQKGWTGGFGKLFLIYTSSGEGSCFDANGTSCAYTNYCGYHSFIDGNAPIIYANEPYGDPNYCQVQGTPSPNNDEAADTAASTASHEITEAMTDPELNAWYTTQGNEIGDLCAYEYGFNNWDGGQANQMWWGHFWELQMEYDNQVQGCVQVGP